MVSRRLERIPRLLVLLVSIACQGVSLRYPENETGRRMGIFADAFSLPHQLAVKKFQKRAGEIDYNDNNHNSPSRNTNTIKLSATIPFYATDVTDKKEKKGSNNSPAFLIESISRVPNVREKTYKSIADLCIDVFFKVGGRRIDGGTKYRSWRLRIFFVQ